MAPAELAVPSPQLMLAVNSPGTTRGLESVKLATTALESVPATNETDWPKGVSRPPGLVMVATLLAVAWPKPRAVGDGHRDRLDRVGHGEGAGADDEEPVRGRDDGARGAGAAVAVVDRGGEVGVAMTVSAASIMRSSRTDARAAPIDVADPGPCPSRT